VTRSARESSESLPRFNKAGQFVPTSRTWGHSESPVFGPGFLRCTLPSYEEGGLRNRTAGNPDWVGWLQSLSPGGDCNGGHFGRGGLEERVLVEFAIERRRSLRLINGWFRASQTSELALHADRLAKLLRGRPAKVNLIPFNPFPGVDFRRSPAGVIDEFRDRLRARGIVATVRRTRGDDIDAACGQLAGQVTDRVRVRLSEKTVRRAASGG